VLRLTCCSPPPVPQIAAGYHQLQPPQIATAGHRSSWHSNRRRVTSNTAEGVRPPPASDWTVASDCSSDCCTELDGAERDQHTCVCVRLCSFLGHGDGRIWTALNGAGRVWTALDGAGRSWTDLDEDCWRDRCLALVRRLGSLCSGATAA
jgi:hypothetical protein